MHLSEVFINDGDPSIDFSVVKRKCSQFLENSQGLPLLKNLPSSYTDLHKVKIRHKQNTSDVSETMNKAFENNYRNLYQRSLFCNGQLSFVAEHTDHEPFYIFPVDGFRFVYCTEVQSSSVQYKDTFDTLLERFGNDKNQTIDILTDLLKHTYTDKYLHEGIDSGAEIIIYNIPCYYAVRCNVVEDYDHLLTFLS